MYFLLSSSFWVTDRVNRFLGSGFLCEIFWRLATRDFLVPKYFTTATILSRIEKSVD